MSTHFTKLRPPAFGILSSALASGLLLLCLFLAPPVEAYNGSAPWISPDSLVSGDRPAPVKAKELFELKKRLRALAAFESNATIRARMTDDLLKAGKLLARIADEGDSHEAVYLHAYDLYLEGILAQSAPTITGPSARDYFRQSHSLLKNLDQDPRALALMGRLYEQGLGVPRSSTAAVRSYYKSGRQFLTSGETVKAMAMLDRMLTLSPSDPLARKLGTLIQGGNERPSQGPLMSTGFICGDGYVATVLHALGKDREISVMFQDGTRTEAAVAATSPAHDLALLALPNNISLPAPLPLAPERPRLAARVFTIGFPHPELLGETLRVTDGRINALSGFKSDRNTIQISVPVQPGNSGGPLLDMKGQVVGVISAGMNAATIYQRTGRMPQNLNFAVKAEALQSLIEETSNASGPKRSPRPGTLSPAPAALEELVERVRGSVVLVMAR